MAAQDSKYLTFRLAEENYALPIIKVKEIIGMMAVTRIPKLPEFLLGVINLRGKIIPIMDLRLKFGFAEREYDDRTSIIVMEMETESGGKESGIVVDAVQEVLEIPMDQVEKLPQYEAGMEQDFLTGIGKVGENVIIILDANKILSKHERKELDSLE